jgi:branched-subunit amino acid aminotransferase/4-amino-4-deoxychorismate lyase
MTYYSINGKIVPKDKAFIHISDLSLHRGYSIFDYCRIRKGKPVFFDDYLDRFERSAEQMLLTIPMSRTNLKAHVQQLIEENEAQEAGLKLILTGGYSEDGYTPAAEANLYILILPPIVLPSFYTTDGIKLMLHEHIRHRADVKITNYIECLLLREATQQANAQDILYHQNGYISESSRSNFYIVTAENVIVTPPKDVLPGITRLHILALAKNHFTVEVRPLRVEELKTAKEAFISSSAKGAIGVIRVDDWTIGNGEVGMVTRQINELYEIEVQAYLASY